MRKIPLCLSAIALLLGIVQACQNRPATQQRGPDMEQIERDIEKQMEIMDRAGKGLKIQSQSAMPNAQWLREFAAELRAPALAINRLPHPDKAFRDMSQDLIESLDALTLATQGQDPEMLRATAAVVLQSCADCHEHYK